MRLRCPICLFEVSVIAALLLTTAGPVGAQIWSKTYVYDHPTFGQPQPHSVVQAADGGVYVAGTVGGQGWVMKLDPFGNIVWNKQLYAIAYGSISGLVETGDGGIAVAAYLGRVPFDPQKLTLIKFDMQGNVIWDIDYGDAGHYGVATGLAEDALGNLYLCGSGAEAGSQNGDLWLVKADSEGNPIWQKSYGGPGNERIYSSGRALALLPNGNIVLTGRTQSWGPVAGVTNLWVLFLDPDGTILSQNAYGGTGNATDIESSVTVMSNGDVLVSALTGSFRFTYPASAWLLRFDTAGNLLWQRAYGSPFINANSVSEVVELPGGDLLMLFNDRVAIRLSPTGAVISSDRYDLQDWTPQGYPVLAGTRDDGVLIGSWGYQAVNGGMRGTWLLRTDAAVSTGSCAVTPAPFTLLDMDTEAVVTATDAVAVDLNLPATVIDNPAWYVDLILSTQDQCGLAVPRIEAVPWRLDFGLVGTSQTATIPVEIRSTGELDLYVSAMDAPPPFGVATTCAGSTVPSGGVCVAEIEFNPPYVGSFTGELTVESDDPATPVLVVPLVGEGTNIIFEDDFESGDIAAWSATVP